MPTETKKITLTLERSQDRIQLMLKVPKEIEDYYKLISEGKTVQSNVWFVSQENKEDEPVGAEFYKLTERKKNNMV